MEYFAWHAYCV